jgi:hypothetical protein
MSIFEKWFSHKEEKKAAQEPVSPETAPEQKEQFEDCVNTTDFRVNLTEGNFAKCQAWVEKVEANRKDFPQYDDSWLADRHREIISYRQLAREGKLESVPRRTKEEAQLELIRRFGFADTDGFRKEIAKGNRALAREWYEYIIDNIEHFPQYYMNQRWQDDRKRELGQ